AGKHNARAAHTEKAKMFQFSAGHNVEAAVALGELMQDGEVAVGLDRETDAVRNLRQSAVKFVVGIHNCGSAVEISRRAERRCGADQVHPLAEDVLLLGMAGDAFPGKVRVKFRGINKGQLLAGTGRRSAHRTFKITRVRSSESGALWANQSTSR